MKIVHNFGLRVDKAVQREFRAAGTILPEGFTSFKIEESDERWPQIKELALGHHAIHTCITIFSNKELQSARNVSMVATWHRGYPEPSDDFGFRSTTYDDSSYCPECGCGLVQKAAFNFAKEQKLGARHMLQLNWVFDEFFVRPDIWERIFKQFGIQKRDVLHIKTGEPLGSVVQISIPEVKVPLVIDGYPATICDQCGRLKLSPITRGPLPPLQSHVNDHIFKTSDYFGSGARAFNEVLISRDLYLAISEARLRGVDFKVVMDT